MSDERAMKNPSAAINEDMHAGGRAIRVPGTL